MPPMRIFFLAHAAFETPGAIREWALERGHAAEEIRLWAGDRLPQPESMDTLVIMGGPMSVNDQARIPWMPAELDLIRALLIRDARMLGVCLGAQLIAAAAGARVYANRSKEIGWHPVRLTDEGRRCRLFAGFPQPFSAFHWHGETFDLPAGAVRLAESDACGNQAFAIGERRLGLQFHLEAGEREVRALAEHCRSDLTDGRFVQPESALHAGAKAAGAVRGLLYSLLDQFACDPPIIGTQSEPG